MYVTVFALRLQMAPKNLDKRYGSDLKCCTAVVQSVEALCYKPESRGFDSRLCY